MHMLEGWMGIRKKRERIGGGFDDPQLSTSGLAD